MRVYALPLTRARPNRPALVYYLASMPRTPQKSKPESRTAALTRKAIQKVVDTWNEWGTMDSGWQKRVYEFGQRAQARIEFEELALRSIDPTLGPRLGSSRGGAGILGELDHSSTNTRTISLLYPSTFRNIVQDDPLAHLQKHLSHHGPKYYRRFWIYVGISPLTIPFTLIPVIPNIPFFFVAWRAWSNYRAYKASDYLESLIAARAIGEEASPVLTEYYTKVSPPSVHRHDAPNSYATANASLPPPDTITTSGKDTHQPMAESLFSESDLLREGSVRELIAALELPKENRGELVNAVRQVRARLGLPKAPRTPGGPQHNIGGKEEAATSAGDRKA